MCRETTGVIVKALVLTEGRRWCGRCHHRVTVAVGVVVVMAVASHHVGVDRVHGDGDTLSWTLLRSGQYEERALLHRPLHRLVLIN